MRKKHFFCVGMVMISMFAIFLLSHQPGRPSVELTERIAVVLNIEEMSGYQYLSCQPWIMGLTVRDWGHIILYGMLGMIAFWAIRCDEEHYYKKLIWSILICFAYSCFDEFHQMFIPQRYGLWEDIVFDAIGYLSTITLCWMVHVFKNLHFHNYKKEQPVS